MKKMAESRVEERISNLKARWYFTKEELMNSPSRAHGIDPEKELSYRQQAANMIQDMGHRLNLNQLCTATAIVYMHRFYMVHSFKTFYRWNVATAALFLSAKVEEQPRKLEYVARVSYSVQNRDAPNLDTQSEVYLKLIEEITYHELMLLETLGFEVAVEHPHPHVVKCTRLVGASKDLSQTAYFMTHNRPTVVACACIHLACRWKGLEIPLSFDKKNWWEYIDKDISLEQLNDLVKEFLKIYEKCPSRLQKKITEPMRLAQQQMKNKQGESSSHSGNVSDKGKSVPSRGSGHPSKQKVHQGAAPVAGVPHHHGSQTDKHQKHQVTQHASGHKTQHHSSSSSGHHHHHHPKNPNAMPSLSMSKAPVKPHEQSLLQKDATKHHPPIKHHHHHHHYHQHQQQQQQQHLGGHSTSASSKHHRSSSSGVLVAEQKYRHEGQQPPQRVAKRPHPEEHSDRKRVKLEFPPLPPASAAPGLPPLPPMQMEINPPPPPPPPSTHHQPLPTNLKLQPLPPMSSLPPLPPPLPLMRLNESPPPPPPPS